MAETKKEYAPVKEFKHGQWVKAWLFKIEHKVNKTYGSDEAVWTFITCDKLESTGQRKFINFWSMGHKVPEKGKETEFYFKNKKTGKPSRLKIALDAFGKEDEVLANFGDCSFKKKPIRDGVKDLLDGIIVEVKVKRLGKTDKTDTTEKEYHLNAEDLRPLPDAKPKEEKAPDSLEE